MELWAGSHPHEHTIGTEEEKLGLVVKIYNVLFNARRPTRDEEIDDCLQRAVEYAVATITCVKSLHRHIFQSRSSGSH